MSKRSVIQLSPRTKGVSLPKQWVEKHALEKGDVLHVSEHPNAIMFSKADISLTKSREVSIDLRGANKAALEDSITAAYRFGYDKMDIKFDPIVIDIWNENVEVDARKVIQAEVSALIGFQVTHLDKNTAIINDITGVNTEQFDHILRRTFLLLHSAARDAHKSLKNKDDQLIEFVLAQYDEIRQYVRYCIRYLAKIGKGSLTPQYIKLVSKLDLARTSLRALVKLQEDKTIKRMYSKEALLIMEDITKLFYDVYKNYYSFSMEQTSDLFERRRKLVGRAYELFESRNRSDAVISTRIVYALNAISSILNVSIALNLEEKE
jgi:phosphate uptake regulator